MIIGIACLTVKTKRNLKLNKNIKVELLIKNELLLLEATMLTTILVDVDEDCKTTVIAIPITRPAS